MSIQGEGMLKMQKSRFAVVCLIFVVLTLKSAVSKAVNSCHLKLHENAHNIIKYHVNFPSENCEKIKDHKMPNSTRCIFKWRKVKYTQPVEPQALEQLETITKLLDESMITVCPNQKRHQLSVCSPEECVRRFMRCWCKYLETAP